ncbi:hypothetical protein F8M41_001064 [Gigaspora margarita]|uniref:Uncharacterized protein n=1 Tax=Gigaspora margarita TaxID=4874 RepID=A0A8H3XHZ5_GIGMA|nr:hypothetical protein F8M41_001064 [Gigaspora margarita]
MDGFLFPEDGQNDIDEFYFTEDSQTVMEGFLSIEDDESDTRFLAIGNNAPVESCLISWSNQSTHEVLSVDCEPFNINETIDSNIDDSFAYPNNILEAEHDIQVKVGDSFLS